MVLDSNQVDLLKNFCALILCGHHEEVFNSSGAWADQ